MAVDLDAFRMSTAEYTQLVEAGALEDVPVELLDGRLVYMSPRGEDHSWVIQRLTVLFGARVDLLHIQLPLQLLEDGWVPEPEVALATRPDRRHPSTAYLAVEVVASKIEIAHGKTPAYARAGIARYWIVDVQGARVIAHREPEDSDYQVIEILAGDDALTTGVEGISGFTVSELLADPA